MSWIFRSKILWSLMGSNITMSNLLIISGISKNKCRRTITLLSGKTLQKHYILNIESVHLKVSITWSLIILAKNRMWRCKMILTNKTAIGRTDLTMITLRKNYMMTYKTLMEMRSIPEAQAKSWLWRLMNWSRNNKIHKDFMRNTWEDAESTKEIIMNK